MALCLCSSLACAAEIYPTKPIRLIVPVAPGGGADITMRIIGQKLFEAWGQQVIVDNQKIIGVRERQHKLASSSWCKSNTRKKWRITLAPSHAYIIAR